MKEKVYMQRDVPMSTCMRHNSEKDSATAFSDYLNKVIFGVIK